MINAVLQNILFAARDVECDLERAYLSTSTMDRVPTTKCHWSYWSPF